MKALFEVTTPYGQAWYDLLYFLAIVLVGIFFMLYGWRRRYPMAAWTLIFAGGIVFFIAGTKLVMFDAVDWHSLFSTGLRTAVASRSVLGGLLSGILGIWLARKIIQFPHPVLDALAIGLPLAMAIQRLGCLMAGCCYGTTTDVPWSVTYGVHAPVFYDHLAHGWIDSAAAASLPVHPTQLYQVFLCLLITIVTWRVRHLFRRPGSLFFFSVGQYLAARFFVEFWNSPETAWLDQPGPLALKHLQWLLITGVGLLVALIVWRERAVVRDSDVPISRTRAVFFYSLLLVIVLWINRGLTPIEVMTVQVLLTIVLFFCLQETIGRKARASQVRVRAVYALSLLLIIHLSLRGQEVYNQLTSDPSARNLFTEITLGYGGLTNTHYHHAPEIVSYGCNAPTVYRPVGPEFSQQSRAFGAAIHQFITFGPYNKLQWGVKASGGHDVEASAPDDLRINFHDVGISAKGDLHWIGMGLGIHTGSGMVEDKEGGYVYTLDHTAKSYILYSGSFRLFPYDGVYAEVRFNEALPFQNHLLAIKPLLYVIGSGLNDKSGSMVEIGSDFKGVFYLAGKAVIRNRFIVKAAIYAHKTEQRTVHFPELSLTYRMLNKRWTAK